jgi:hypothetical protein
MTVGSNNDGMKCRWGQILWDQLYVPKPFYLLANLVGLFSMTFDDVQCRVKWLDVVSSVTAISIPFLLITLNIWSTIQISNSSMLSVIVLFLLGFGKIGIRVDSVLLISHTYLSICCTTFSTFLIQTVIWGDIGNILKFLCFFYRSSFKTTFKNKVAVTSNKCSQNFSMTQISRSNFLYFHSVILHFCSLWNFAKILIKIKTFRNFANKHVLASDSICNQNFDVSRGK